MDFFATNKLFSKIVLSQNIVFGLKKKEEKFVTP